MVEKSNTHMSDFPRDLLNRFMAASHHNHHHHHFPMHLVKQEQSNHHHHDGLEDAGEAEEEEEEIELSLGLSMNGRFGVDPTAAKKIKRTTSIPEFVKPTRDSEEESGHEAMPRVPLIRTCSLPTETEEEWRKRKELQSLRRLEARRKRSEKQRNLRVIREQQQQRNDVVFEGGGYNNPVEQGEFGGGLGRTASLSSRVGGLGLNDKCGVGVGLPPPSPSPGGSIGSNSQGTASSGISESESQQGQGPKAMDASRSPMGPNSLPSCEYKSPAATSGAKIAEISGKFAAAMAVRHESANRHASPESKTKDIVKNLLEDMPCVSTKGTGPDGRRIEGFLYRYGKGEDVRIVCVCHGSFLTPAEFVKHAGGGDVTNPLKHIVVSTSC